MNFHQNTSCTQFRKQGTSAQPLQGRQLDLRRTVNTAMSIKFAPYAIMER